MLITKRQIIEDAFAEVGLAGYIFDIEPGALNRALRVLDAMMAEWNLRGIQVGYTFGPNSDPDTEIDILDASTNAITLNLALRLGTSFGKVIQPLQVTQAKNAFKVLANSTAEVPETRSSGMIYGAGRKSIRPDTRFIPTPSEPLSNGMSELDILL